MSNSFIKLINDSKFEFNNITTINNILSLNCHSIQTGIGDILLTSTLVKNDLIKLPLFINIAVYTNNPYNLTDTNNSFSFKIKLLEKLFESGEIVFYYNSDIYYSDWPRYLKSITNFSVLDKNFDLTNFINEEYIIFHTKCRFTSDFNYEKLKHNMRIFCENFKTKYKIIILGEKQMPSNFEANVHKITTIYEELIKLKKNNDVLDLSIDNIYDNLDFENFCKDISIIHNAKTNILVGHGGQFCISILFGKNTIAYFTEHLSDSFKLDFHQLEKSERHVIFDLFKFFDKIKEDLSM
uniref:Polysaccharide pyruvyl transferase domain-containing protein n=1 Tax=viral metagenome TaxID=1070528 RepID=A0A6C0B1S0_9ZZZZ